jgi:hypothetical protein
LIRSANLARPMTFLLLSLLTALLVATGTSTNASAATQYGNYTLYTTNELCKLTVTPKQVTVEAGVQQTFTATLTAIGPAIIQVDSVDAGYSDTFSACAYKQIDALEGVTVNFKVLSGPNAGKTQDVPLSAGGVANFTFTSAVAGTDVVEAALTLPDICYTQYNGAQETSTQAVPAACEIYFPQSPQVAAISQCPELQAEAVNQECPTVTLSDSGQVTWTVPPVVEQTADPTLSIARIKRCVTGPFKITPSYAGGTIKSSTLFVDGKQKSTRSGAEPFSLSARSYKAGKHNFEVVTVFTSGKAASKFGSFTRCAARVTVKRVSPKFTG